MASRPRVHVIACGGTASSVETAAGLEPQAAGASIIKATQDLADFAQLTAEDFSRKLSSQFSSQDLYRLGLRVRRAFEDETLAGVVVLHGTGGMEESAYMTDLMVSDPRPVVFTGAMRPATDLISDRSSNLSDAVRVSVSSAARKRGALVTMNGWIHSARGARKAHTTSIDAFESRPYGPLGFVSRDQIHFEHPPSRGPELMTETPVFDVDLVKFVVGMDDRFIRASIEQGAKAIVIEGSGAGNVNETVARAIDDALTAEIVVVLCSRTGAGPVEPIYGTKAGGRRLQEAGCLVSSLPGVKARILLMLALGDSAHHAELGRLLTLEE